MHFLLTDINKHLYQMNSDFNLTRFGKGCNEALSVSKLSQVSGSWEHLSLPLSPFDAWEL